MFDRIPERIAFGRAAVRPGKSLNLRKIIGVTILSKFREMKRNFEYEALSDIE
jgi:hypothetical protein